MKKYHLPLVWHFTWFWCHL